MMDRLTYMTKECLPAGILSHEAELAVNDIMLVVENGFKCTKCNLVTKSKLNMKWHVHRMHASGESATQDNIVKTPPEENTENSNQSVQFLKIEEVWNIWTWNAIKNSLTKMILTFTCFKVWMKMNFSIYSSQSELLQWLKLKKSIQAINSNHFDSKDESKVVDDCDLCANSTQHVCKLCNQFVCVILCSVQDPISSNEMHRDHRKGDKRCKPSSFECPSCDTTFVFPENL